MWLVWSQVPGAVSVFPNSRAGGLSRAECYVVVWRLLSGRDVQHHFLHIGFTPKCKKRNSHATHTLASQPPDYVHTHACSTYINNSVPHLPPQPVADCGSTREHPQSITPHGTCALCSLKLHIIPAIASSQTHTQSCRAGTNNPRNPTWQTHTRTSTPPQASSTTIIAHARVCTHRIPSRLLSAHPTLILLLILRLCRSLLLLLPLLLPAAPKAPPQPKHTRPSLARPPGCIHIQ